VFELLDVPVGHDTLKGGHQTGAGADERVVGGEVRIEWHKQVFPFARVLTPSRRARKIDSKIFASELSNAGGPARPHCKLAWPARIRSSVLVRQNHGFTQSLVGAPLP